MNTAVRNCIALALFTFTMACKAQVLHHDEDVAAAKATAFVTAAVVKQDWDAAYMMMREEDRRTVALARFTEVMKTAHPSGFPTEVHATEFEPVPGQPAIQIFLEGRNGKERFYYRVPLVGTSSRGYFPQGLFRGNMPYPKSGLRRPLKL